MNGTASVIVPATITDISDGPYFYAACQQCYSKLVESADTFSCPKCRRKLSRDKVEFRYRLSMTVTDFSTFATVTAFGGILNAYFGCPASEFGKRWITKLQGLVGSLEPSVTKWAVEESLVGCHLHFGFRSHPKALEIHKAGGKHGISLHDIKLHCGKSYPYQRTDSSLVAVQMIAQNDSQLPVPAIAHLQHAMSSFDKENVSNFMEGPFSTENEIQKFIHKKYSRNCQMVPCQNSTSSLKFHVEDSSVLSSLDQTSIALDCSTSLRNSLPSDKLTVSQQSQASDPLGARRRSKFETDNVHFVNSQCITDARILSEGKPRMENGYINQSSVLLFESPKSVLSYHDNKIQEVPREGGDGDCSLVPCALNGNIDLSYVETKEVSNNSSDLCYLSSYLSESKDCSNAPFPLSHFANCEIENPKSLETVQINSSPKFRKCEELTDIKNSEKEKLHCKKISYGKLSLKGSSWKSNSNERVHSKLEKSVDFLGAAAVSYSERMDENLINSFTDHEAVTSSTPLDMPESEDLELFLKAAADDSMDQHKRKVALYYYPSTHNLENNRIIHQSIHCRESDIKDKERKPSSPYFKQWKSSLTHPINKQSCDNTISADIDWGLADLRTSSSSTLKQQIRFNDGRRHPQTSEAYNIHDSSVLRARGSGLEHEKGDFQGEFVAVEKFDKHFNNNLSVAGSYKPFNLLDSSVCKATNCDKKISLRPQSSSRSGELHSADEGEMNASCDLFSSPEALDSSLVNNFQGLIIENKTSPSKIDFNDDHSLAINTGERLFNSIDSDWYSVRAENLNNVESHVIRHDASFDLFSAPDSEADEKPLAINTGERLCHTIDSDFYSVRAENLNNVENHVIYHDASHDLFLTSDSRIDENISKDVSRSVSPGFQPDCNSFDLFSSSEDEF